MQLCSTNEQYKLGLQYGSSLLKEKKASNQSVHEINYKVLLLYSFETHSRSMEWREIIFFVTVTNITLSSSVYTFPHKFLSTYGLSLHLNEHVVQNRKAKLFELLNRMNISISKLTFKNLSANYLTNYLLAVSNLYIVLLNFIALF